MIRVAIVGAGGFVGSRILEMAGLGHEMSVGIDVVPVVRQARGIARNSKLGLASFVTADTRDVGSLRSAFENCSAVVNLTMGDDSRIATDVQQIHKACKQAGVPTFIHVSSAEVFGRCDTPDLNDDSPWFRRHWMAYARAKGEAEDFLRAQTGDPSIVVLRPGLIWGPRSTWVSAPAEMLLSGTAWQVDGGRWACNLCHVDNLVNAIFTVARSPLKKSGFYNLGDPGRPRWAEYWTGLAAEMKIRRPAIASIAEGDFRVSMLDRLIALKGSALAKAVKRRLRNATKERIKNRLLGIRERFLGQAEQGRSIAVTKPLWWLQTTRYHLPASKFPEDYPDARFISFAEGMHQTGFWLRYSGFSSTDTDG